MAVTVEALSARLQQAFVGDKVDVTGDGYHFQVTIVSSRFTGLRAVQKQQHVYAAVQDWIASGELHALSMRTFTPEEWSTNGNNAG
ncbi:BolA/IbaG family iron-sulfur metabolism protein [Permianibacter sp. IMCC34836]|uniref:BolA family protein n=1 Tax=Permianibacter fluminis TaxID=2738515 RepID=UPI00155166E9|nr:BolA/IbaG family iron-sulfur metabolism protein [Permianibacter fluminis]NQD39034.1 BolA/IbaG family iron-sulfur metabolism protein [Permianibacter fluminis]